MFILTYVLSNNKKCSIGRSLRTLAESDPKPLTENFAVKESLTAGEMVSKESLDKLIHTNILQFLNKKGIIIDGYPRDINQVYDFEEKVCELKIFKHDIPFHDFKFRLTFFPYYSYCSIIKSHLSFC